MSIDQIIEILLNHGSLGVFAGYLIWESNRLRKQQDQLVNNFQQSLENIRSDSAENEKDLRERYDSVISQLQSEKSQSSGALADKVKNLSTRMETLEKTTQQICSNLETLTEKINDMKMREIARSSQKVSL